MFLVAVVLAFATTVASQTVVPALPTQPNEPPAASIALVSTFADGRVQYQLVTTRPGAMWTPAFPRIESWTPPDGALPVTALKMSWQLVDGGVRAAISVLRGPTHEREDAVATVRVSEGSPVTVNELRAFGVEPITLSITEAAPIPPFLPSVFSVTPELEVSAVDILAEPYPGYRITVRNLSTKALANFHVQAFRGPNATASLVPRGRGGRPAAAPGESYSFELYLTSGGGTDPGVRGWSPPPWDVIEIVSVMWADGTIEGDRSAAYSQRSIPELAGRRVQLTRAIEILRVAEGRTGAPAEIVAAIRAGIERLPITDETRLSGAAIGMRDMKAAILDDVRRFEQRGTPPALDEVRRWIRETIDRYQRWSERLSP